MSQVLVKAAGVGKAYPKAYLSGDRLRALARLLVGRRDADAQYVVKDIDLCVRRGESIAVIGQNGAGKSTLLKLRQHPARGIDRADRKHRLRQIHAHGYSAHGDFPFC